MESQGTLKRAVATHLLDFSSPISKATKSWEVVKKK